MFFSSTCTKQSKTSSDGYDDAYGTGTSLPCNYDKVEKLIQGFGNQQFKTCAWVQLQPGTTVLKTDKITLADGTTSPIVFIDHIKPPFSQEVCVEVWLGASTREWF